MLSLLFFICMIWIVGKLFFFGVKAAWGISKLVLTIVLLPLLLIVFAASGLFFIAFFILIVAGFAVHIGNR